MFEAVYGGARGGGKTDAAIGDFALHALRYGAAARGLFVRRTRVALEPTIARARQIYRPLGASWREQKSRFDFANGAVLYFRYLERDGDADNYQGHDYTRLYVEELTQFSSPAPVERLKATLRSAAGAPTGFRATCNPGGPGHAWVKARHIDPGPWIIVAERRTSPFDGSELELGRVFIPARLSDNRQLLQHDPLYVARLQQSGSKALVRAWLEGDWNAVEGAFFDAWSAANIIDPFAVPAEWLRFRSFDWGSARPFSVGWWAVADGSTHLPRGALVRYREWYGSSGKPNEGLKLTAEQVAHGIAQRSPTTERYAYSVADPAVFAADGGPSIAERMALAGVNFVPADNRRVGRGGAMGGWDQMRARIRGDDDGPQLFVFSTCRDFIRTVPSLQHDPVRAEDLDTAAEDHVADEARYACMSRPWIPVRGSEPPRKRYSKNRQESAWSV